MKTYAIGVTVGDMLNALDRECDRRGLEYSELSDTLELDVDASMDTDIAAAIAYDHDFVRAADALDGLDPNACDLADGLRALIAGDRGTASIMLTRALDAWPDAVRVVEDTLAARTVRDRRQPTLLAA